MEWTWRQMVSFASVKRYVCDYSLVPWRDEDGAEWAALYGTAAAQAPLTSLD